MTVRMGDAAVYLGADQSGLDRDLDRAGQSTQGWLGRISDGIGIAIGGAVVSAVGKLAQGIAAVGGQVLQMSGDIDVATGQLQTRLGLTNEQALIFGDTIRQVYGDNFGESIDDVGQQVAIVGQQLAALDQLTEENLGKTTEYAIALRDAFDADVGGSVNAAGVLVDKFGLTWDEAFSLITSGMQRGLNSSGDFLESITEYGVQFAEGGATAAEFFSVMESGLQAGMLGTDKAADLFKEFRVRIQDGSDATAEGLRSIGLSADEMNERMADGSLTAADAFQLIQEKLALVEDENVRFQAGVALMGTQYEDLGGAAVAGIDMALRSMDDLSGATDSLNRQYENLPSMFEGWKRRAILAMQPIADKLLEFGSRITPYVEKAFGFLQDKVVPILSGIADKFGDTIGRVFGAIDKLVQRLSGWGIDKLFVVFEDGSSILGAFFENLGMAEAPAQRLAEITIQFVNGVQDLWTWITNLLQPLADALIQFVSWQDILTAIGIVLAATILPLLVSFVAGILAAAAPVVLVIGGIALAVAALRQAWETDFAGIRDFANGVWFAIKTAFSAFKDLFAGDFDGFLTKLRWAWAVAWHAITEFLGNIWVMVQPKLAALWESVSAWFQSVDWAALALMVITFIADTLGELWSFVLPKLAEWHQAVGDWFRSIDWKKLAYDLITNILTGLDEFWTRAKPIVEGWWKSTEAWFDSINWGELAQKIIDGLVSVLRNSTEFLGALLDMARGAWDAVVDFFKPGSPSKIAQQLARQIKAGFTSEFDNDGDVATSAGNMAQSLYNAMVGQLTAPAYAQPAAMPTYTNYNQLTIYTSAPYEPIVEDYRMMQNWRQQP